MNKDPYLIPGCPCWIWDNYYQQYVLAEFYGYQYLSSKQRDVSCFKQTGEGLKWDCKYKVIETEWSFAPKWALDPKNQDVCSTVDRDGRLRIFMGKPFREDIKGWWWPGPQDMMKMKMIACGTCPDKTRYEGDAWKTSLRMRPEWAKVG